ncbi:uncharacterized protein [Miscanthus floridulus]|uniref:uncharacterized protein n=1 Tax=Miscanthus floridulus TaxID=154761 RepID=UPI00345874F3
MVRFLLVVFRRFLFRLTEDSVAMALHCCLGGTPAGFHVSFQKERHFRFSVASKNVGLLVRALKRITTDHFDIYFHLWRDGGADWKREWKNWEKEEEASWTTKISKKSKHRTSVGSLLCPASSPSRMHIGASPFALDSEKHAGLSSNQVQCRDFETVKDGREEHSATENFLVDPITSVVQASPDVLASHRLNGAHRAVSSSVVPVQTVFKRLERDLDINCNDILAANCPILFSRSNIMKCSSPKGHAKKPLEEVIQAAQKAPPSRDFYGASEAAYKRNGVPALTAEVKKASPSRGVLRENFDPVEIAQAYEKNGAACLSILTDEKYFQGSFENLEKVRTSGVKCPLLCKEFVIDKWQIYNARSKGADAILLIAAVLPDVDITYCLKICAGLGMTALIEVHDEREMERVLKINGVKLLGIYNRSLETFVVDTSNTKMLLEKHGDSIREKGILVVGESGLFTPDDVAYVQNAGVSAVSSPWFLVNSDSVRHDLRNLFGNIF